LVTSLFHFWPPPIFNPDYAYVLELKKNRHFDFSISTCANADAKTPFESFTLKEFSQHVHNVFDRGVLQAMWEELAGKVVHRDQLIIY